MSLRISPRTPDGVSSPAVSVERVLAAAGGLLVLLSLFWTWNYVSGRPVSAWSNYARTDWLVAAAAAVVLGGAALSARRVGRLLELAGSLVVIAVLVRVLRDGDFVRGPALAALGALVVIAAVLLESAPAGVRRRLDGVAEPARRSTGVAGRGARRVGDAARRHGIPLPRSVATGEWSGFAARAWPIVTFTPLVAVLVWLLAAPLPPLAPGAGTDASWVTALQLIRRAHMDFGTEIVWTYGPLGYLTVPRVVSVAAREQAMLGYAYMTVAYWALAATTLAIVRRSVGVVLAFVAALIVLETFRATGRDEQTQFAIAAMAYGWGLMALRAERLPASRWWPLLQAALGVFAAVAALVKLNTGITVVLVLGVTALATTVDWRRPVAVAAFAAGFVAGFVGLWLALDQSLSALDDYLRTSYEVIAGFADYMQSGQLPWLYVAAAAILGGVAVLAWRETRSWPPLRRAGGLLITALVMFNAFKQGYVRHDGISLFATGVFVALALGSREVRPRWGAWGVAAVSLLAFFAAANPALYDFHRPRGTVRSLRETIETLRHPEALVQASLDEARQREAIPPRAIALIGHRSVHIFPQEAAAAWSQPSLDWRPLPIFQAYQAYTPALTEQNADVLRSDRAPARILRHVEPIGFSDPATTIEVMCRYVQVFADAGWQVLARVPDRCGRPAVVSRVSVHTEQPVSLPPVGDDELLLMRVEGFGKSLGESLLGLLWKPHPRSATLDDGSGQVIAASLAPLPALVAAGGTADYPGDYKLALRTSTLTFHMTTQGVTSPLRSLDRALTVEFLRVPVSRPGADPAAGR